MESEFSVSIKWLRRFFKIFTFSYFVSCEPTVSNIAEVVYISIYFVFMIYLIVSSIYESWRRQTSFEIRGLILVGSFQVYLILPLSSAVYFRYNANRLKNLIRIVENKVVNEECFKTIQISLLCRRCLVAIVLFLTVWLLIRIYYVSNSIIRKTNNYFVAGFVLLNDLWIIVPVTQFLCWMILIKIMSCKVMNNMRDVMARNSFDVSDKEIVYFLMVLNRVMKVKNCTLEVYGANVTVFLYHVTISIGYRVYAIIREDVFHLKTECCLLLVYNLFAIFMLFWNANYTTVHVRELFNLMYIVMHFPRCI